MNALGKLIARLFMAGSILAIIGVMVGIAYALGNGALSWDYRARWAAIAMTAILGAYFTLMHYGAVYHNKTTKSDRHVSLVFPIGGCSLTALSIMLPWTDVEKRNEYAWLFAFLDPATLTHTFGALYILVAPDKEPEK